MSRASDADATREAILSEYIQRTPRSAEAFSRAETFLVGGVTGSLRYFSPYPLYFRSGEGAYVTDVDGNRYLDCFLCNGPMLLGHRHPTVMKSIEAEAATGLLVVNPLIASEVAAQLCNLHESAERVRLVSSGTEAVLTAIRCARAYTGRNKIIKFFGHYHGQFDQVLVGMGQSRRALFSGIPDSTIADTRVLPYGDIETLEQALGDDEDIAAIVLDPAMHNGGLWGSQPAYLSAVRELTDRRGVILIFDEVITGFRLGVNGAQGLWGIRPDITTFAKALAAGEKLGAIAGRADVMSVLDPRQNGDAPRAFQSGTTNDGTTALAAARAAVQVYQDLWQDGSYDMLFELSEFLASGLREIFRRKNVPCHVNQLGPMLQMFLTQREPSFANYAKVSTEPLRLFSMAMLAEGILFALPGSTHVYLSFRHNRKSIEDILAGAERVLERYDFANLVNVTEG